MVDLEGILVCWKPLILLDILMVLVNFEPEVQNLKMERKNYSDLDNLILLNNRPRHSTGSNCVTKNSLHKML